MYTEHCRAGGILFFRSEDTNVTYPPSLISAVRLPRSPSSKEVVVDDTTVDPAGDPTGAPA